MLPIFPRDLRIVANYPYHACVFFPYEASRNNGCEYLAFSYGTTRYVIYSDRLGRTIEARI